MPIKATLDLNEVGKWIGAPLAAKRVEADLKHSTSCASALHADTNDETHAEKIDESVTMTKNAEQLKQPIAESQMDDCENDEESKLKRMITRDMMAALETAGLATQKGTVPNVAVCRRRNRA